MAAAGPNPSGNKPAGIPDDAWYGYTTVDSSIPLSQWQAWSQYYDPKATGYARYKSDKVDQNGQPIQGLFEQPDACPDGTTAYGQNQCVPTSDPRVQGAWNTQVDPSTGKPYPPGQGPSSAAAQQVPPAMWDTAGNYNAGGSGTADTSIAPAGSLQDQLQQMLATKAGAFGYANGRTPTAGYAGSLTVDQNGNPLSQAPPMFAKALSGGGLLWSNNDLGLTPPPAPTPTGGGGGGGGVSAQTPTPVTAPTTTPSGNGPWGSLGGTNNAGQPTTPWSPAATAGLPFGALNSSGLPPGYNAAQAGAWQNQTPSWQPGPANSGGGLSGALTNQKMMAMSPNRNNQYAG